VKAIGTLLLTTMLATYALASDLTTAQVLSIKKYERGRISYWEGGIPIYDDYPVYDISIKVAEKTYIVRYESTTGYYPRIWSVGNEIKVKQERGQFGLMNREEEVKARIVSEYECNPHSRRPTGWSSTWSLPCE
jgi:hypothetical protein